MPREVATEHPLFCLRFHVSVAEPNFLMAEAPVPIPPDVLVAALPAAEAAAAAEVPAAGDNPVAPAEEVSWFLSLYCGCFLLPSWSTFEMCGVCRLCFHGVCRLASLFSWRVSPSKFVFMACVAFQVCFHGVCRLQFSLWRVSPFELVFGVCRLLSLFSWRVSPSKFVFMACVALQRCFHGVCRLQFSLYGVCRRFNKFLACVAF